MLDVKSSGARFYIENYQAQDYLHGAFSGIRVMGRERFFFQEYIEYDGHALQSRNGFYLPSSMRSKTLELATVTNCIGTHKVFRAGTISYPVLRRSPDGNVITALTDLSAYDSLFRTPRRFWRELWIRLLAELASVSLQKVERAFDDAFAPVIALSSSNTSSLAVEKALNWHRNSGLFRAEDGSAGMYEMLRSNDLGIRANLRTDATLLTAALFATAGHLRQKEELSLIGCNLADFILETGNQRPDGFFKWFSHRNAVWASDSGRDGLAIWQLYKATGKERYKRASLMLADAFLRWLEKDGLCCGSFEGDCIPKERVSTDNPVYYGEMVSFLLQLGGQEYTKAALRVIARISERFPAVSPFGFSENFTWCRWLLMLSSAQYHTNEDFSSQINDALGFFERLQEACGGIRETAIRLGGHDVEAGIAIGDGSDCIADMLYCNNYVLNSLSILMRLHPSHQGSIDLDKVKSMYSKQREFWLYTQISSKNPKLDGAWMRAFDMRLNEYFGLNKDMDWGAYC
ncbi:MAG: hypothetical protein J5746_07985, partial [Victivallales bacterium]|nr:hypothetical protein [Victivallales bacterium]